MIHNAADKEIGDILARYGEPFASSVWRVQGRAVIYHKALERIASTAGIRFETPKILRAERDEAVILVAGNLPIKGKPDRVEWSIGEALVNVNYRVSGKQSAYVYAMAEKRGKDRVILKLIDLHGLVYSEDEDDEFKASARQQGTAPGRGDDQSIKASMTEIEGRIDGERTPAAVISLMQSEWMQQVLAPLVQGERDAIRAHATARLRALGWVSPREAGRRQPGSSKPRPSKSPVQR